MPEEMSEDQSNALEKPDDKESIKDIFDQVQRLYKSENNNNLLLHVDEKNDKRGFTKVSVNSPFRPTEVTIYYDEFPLSEKDSYWDTVICLTENEIKMFVARAVNLETGEFVGPFKEKGHRPKPDFARIKDLLSRGKVIAIPKWPPEETKEQDRSNFPMFPKSIIGKF